jgi:hypothetical protein
MSQTALIKIDSCIREATEVFVKNIYRLQYDANLDGFPARPIAHPDDELRINCAARLRAERDCFFSENYLKAPITASGQESVARSDFRSQRSQAARRRRRPGYGRSIIACGQRNGFLRRSNSQMPK